MDLERELIDGWADHACEICREDGVVLFRQRFFGTSEDAYVCANCLADLRSLEPERGRP